MNFSALKSLILVILVIAGFSASAQTSGEVCYNPNLVKDSSKKSIKSMAFSVLKSDSIKIVYHSPGVRKRVIWGGLVPYDEVWVTGAHDATTLEMPFPFIVNGKEIPAGKYALFTIPGKKTWTFIINKNWEQHLASEYDEKDDVIRIQVKPAKVSHTERLQYFIDTDPAGKGSIYVAWENQRVGFPFSVKK
ncbi:DUF2911 domain-containing protein [Flavihumibacter solisilvae]|uniref:Asparagine synthetase B n=1 Tax=Flavihumibacter solisilvae TaxID=1349421 RepID=A0A0C1LE18_9BACT|nr:DUF2911 domain-containing protein [Flavihumibacter solisilvae]KIC93693.1 hypothetical protein OI18_16185 [Flavihumibacter solisilvae]